MWWAVCCVMLVVGSVCAEAAPTSDMSHPIDWAQLEPSPDDVSFMYKENAYYLINVVSHLFVPTCNNKYTFHTYIRAAMRYDFQCLETQIQSKYQ